MEEYPDARLPQKAAAVADGLPARSGKATRYCWPIVPGVQTPPTLNLAAWARGEEEHIWPEVKRAINWYLLELGVELVNFQERYEAVDWLVAEGFIEVSEARKDLPRPLGEKAP